MAYPTPLRDLFEHADARWEPYGPPPEHPTPDAGAPPVHTRSPIDVAGQFDHIDIEYAAIRKSSALLDLPHRGTLVFTGADRIAFLNRMVTQELKDAAEKPFTSRRAFWLNRKGRIDADLRLIVLNDRIIADVDAFAAPHARQSLDAYVIADDVAIEDATQRFHRLSLQGPGGPAVLASFSKPLAGVAVADIKPGEVSVIDIDGHQIIVDRWDSAGEIGLELTLEPAAAAPVFQRLLEAAHRNAPGHVGPNPRPQLRPIGWHAYNIARIEAGTPLFMLDFGPDALPAESGVLNDRVSFKKGCYLGQEIVARMNALGHPKQTLVGLKFEPSPASDAPLLPLAGAPVFLDPLPTDRQPEPIGTIASATASPMLSGTPIAFAMVKFKQAAAGTKVHVPCLEHPEAQPVLRPATVQPSLTFWSRVAPV